VPLMAGQNQVALAIRKTEDPIGICFDSGAGFFLVPSVTPPATDFGAGNRGAETGIQNKSFKLSAAAPHAHHQSQFADPTRCVMNLIFQLFVKIGIVAGNQEIKTGRQIFGDGNHFLPVVIVFRGREFNTPAGGRFPFKKFLPLIVVKLFPPVTFFGDQGFPVIFDRPQVKLGQIAVGDGHFRPGSIQDPFGLDLQ